MTTRLTLAIQEHHEQLSPSERKLAELLLGRADDLLTYSATELAAMAGVSKATAARLFRSLGYADFNEVRLQAREERNLAPPFQATSQPARAGREALARAHSIAAHLQAEGESLARTFESLRSDTLQAAADLLAKAPRVWLVGIGVDEGLARFVRPQLARARPDVHLLGTQSGVWAEDLAMTGPRDALLLVLTQPRTGLIEKLLTHAATTRLDSVAVVNIRNAAWARRTCTVVLPCYGAGAGDADSATMAASMLHLLIRNTAVRVGARARQRHDLVAHISRELEGD
jgi:DNA-binding MurR/RpiR family transcriptional regulator